MRTLGRLLRVVAVTAICLVVLSACGGSTRTPPPRSASLLPSGPTALPAFDPTRFRSLLAELHGKPVVVNFWGSWCGPCRQEAPHLAAASRTYQGRVQFLGVDVTDFRTPARAFIRQFGWTYPSVFDPTGAIRSSFGLVGAPHTMIFDANGNRTFLRSGPVDQQMLESEINKVLGMQGVPATSPPGY